LYEEHGRCAKNSNSLVSDQAYDSSDGINAEGFASASWRMQSLLLVEEDII
jgi:hypothetical protein